MELLIYLYIVTLVIYCFVSEFCFDVIFLILNCFLFLSQKG
ncbi:hypothetical protein BrE312_3004 [Brenneria sp. EniD312]|nr:hypothetical protein BrE312_3004 [Brenneria sp. EniD312]